MYRYEVDVDTRFVIEAENYDEALEKIDKQLLYTDGEIFETRKVDETEIINVHPDWKFTKQYEDEYGMFGHSEYFGEDLYICKASKKIYAVCYAHDIWAIISDEIDLCTDDPNEDRGWVNPVILSWFCYDTCSNKEAAEFIYNYVKEYEKSAYVFFMNIVKNRDEQIAEAQIKEN